MLAYVFYILSAISIGSALMMVFSKNPVHSVLYLIATFFSIAAHFIILNADFLAIVQIIVYTGAIMVLFLYVIMLLNLNSESEVSKSTIVKVAAALSAGLLFLVMVASFKESVALPVSEVVPGLGSVKNLGKVLFSEYLLPFEATSVLFLSAMAGAVLLAKKK
jgi:NADH-quinone oxidoreductase subunit J